MTFFFLILDSTYKRHCTVLIFLSLHPVLYQQFPHNSSCPLCFRPTSLLSVPLIKLFLASGLCICWSLCLEYCPLFTPKLSPTTDTHAHQLIYIHPQVSTYRSLSCKSFSMTLVILTHGLLDCFFRA